MNNLPVSSIVSLPGDKLSLLCESNHFKQKAEQLEKELQQMWAENALLRHAMRTHHNRPGKGAFFVRFTQMV